MSIRYGIIRHKDKFPEKELEEIITDTIGNYFAYITKNNRSYQHAIIIQGVPCPNIDIRNHSKNDIERLAGIIKMFNYELKIKSTKKRV